jgi:hypothetical protein
VPVMSGITPLFTSAGGAAFMLTVNGSGLPQVRQFTGAPPLWLQRLVVQSN